MIIIMFYFEYMGYFYSMKKHKKNLLISLFITKSNGRTSCWKMVHYEDGSQVTVALSFTEFFNLKMKYFKSEKMQEVEEIIRYDYKILM